MPDRLRLEVRDFGPIVKAKIDLRPLTVLVGPNNTGKSYLAILVYALHRLWSASTPGQLFLWRGDGPLPAEFFMDESEQSVDAIVEFAEHITDRARKSSSTKTFVLPIQIAETLGRSYDKYGSYLDDEIRRCFGIEDSAALIRRGAQKGARVSVRFRNRGSSATIGQDLRIGAQDSLFRTTIPGNTTLPANTFSRDSSPCLFEALTENRRALRKRQGQELRDIYRLELLEALAAAIHPLVFGPLARGAFYLPADRTGVMHAHSVVVSALIGGAAMAGVRPATRTPMLSGVLADFLKELIELGQRPGTRHRSHCKLGDGIETTILKGSIGVEKSETVGYPHFTYNPEGWKGSLSLANASSMVSELAPIVLYLRHQVEPGNLLIIEEPETHLHPAMQVQLTREIAALVQAGIRVVVTTHSEWVLEELANIVGRSKLSEHEEDALPVSDVGVWLFEPKERPGGTMVKEVRLDESGLYSPGFGEVAAALHNEWADIHSRVEEGG